MGFSRTIRQAKQGLGRVYNDTVRFASQFDRGLGTAKKVLSIAAPILTAMAPGPTAKIIGAVAQGIGKYAELKEQVVNAHDAAQQVAQSIPNIGL